MKKKLLGAVLLAAGTWLAGCGRQETPIITGEGAPISRIFEVEDFNGIEAGGSFDVTFSIAPETSVELQMPENLMDLHEVRVRNGQLQVRTPSGTGIQWGGTRPQLVVFAPDLDHVNLSGGASFWGRDLIQGESLEVNASGLASLDLDVDVVSLNVNASGTAQIGLRGTAQNSDFNVSGIAVVSGRELSTGEAVIQGSGSSLVEILVLDLLDANLSGTSQVSYWGNPLEQRSRLSGTATIHSQE